MNTASDVSEKDCPIEPIWILKYSISSVFFTTLVLIFYSFDPERAAAILVYFIILILVVIFQFIALIIRLRTYHYSLGEKYLDLSQGFIKKQSRHVPYGVIQTVILKRDLLDRLLGLASLKVENASGGGVGLDKKKTKGELAGFMGNVISIPGLNHHNAQLFKTLILEKVRTNPIIERGM